ncbi:MAG: glycosyltransferase [Treponema sp.]|jgi:rhamnosyl/mannosyltransferase|nr:glycosyltransferase [Treponema sp.]
MKKKCNDKIKVLQINKFYAPWVGGVERVVQNIAEGLNDKSDMKVLVCQSQGKAEETTVNNIQVIRSSSLGVLYSMPVSFDFIFKLWKLSRQYDILLFHTPFPLADLACLFSGYRGKIVVWWHSDIISQRRLLKVITPILKWFLRRADVVVAATQAHIDNSAFLGPYKDKCRVIPFGLKFSDYEQVSMANYLMDRLFNKQNKKALFVGRLVYYKGIDILIQAMRAVRGAELFIAGSGVLECELKARVEAEGLGEKIHFLGYLPFEELKAAYADCDVFVFPSNANVEAFGLAQMEAMFYGKPVVNTNLPTGVPLVSVDGKTGLTVPVNDADALSRAIQRLIDDGELRSRLGANARQRVYEEYSFDRMMDKVYELCEELANHGSTKPPAS